MKFLRSIALILVALAATVPVLAQNAQGSAGVVEGTVINKNTQRFLERAKVSVLNTELSVLTDTEGRFRIAGLTAGTYEVTASYSGLGDTTKTVTVTGDAVTRVAFELTSLDVYESSEKIEVVVATPLEGIAYAVNQQRRAETVRTVVSVDAFIDQTTGNAGEFLKSVQGIQMDYSQNEPQRVRVRGFDPNLTTLTMDGNEIASAASTSTDRAVQVDQLSIASIGNVEVYKAPIPSMSANAIGGAVNFNTKSAFEQEGRRGFVQFGLNVDGNSGFSRYAGPGHGEKSTQRGLYPVGRFEYSNSFFKNRLGLFFSTGHDRTNQLGSSVTHNLTYANQPAAPTLVTLDNTTVRRGAMSFAPNRQLRQRDDVSLNSDFRLTDEAALFLKTSFSGYHSTNRNHGFTLTPGTLAAGSTVTDYTTTGTNSTASQAISVFDKYTSSWQINPGLRFRSGDWKLDLVGGFSKSINHYDNDTNFGALSINLANVNWTMSTPLDTDTPSSITQTSGLDFYNLNNYKPNQGDLAATGGQHRANHNGIVSTNVRQSSDFKKSFRFDLQRDFHTRYPFHLKGGLAYNQAIRDKNQPQRRWYWMGPDGIATADDLTAAGAQLGRFAEPVPVTQDLSGFNLREPTYFSSTLFRKFWETNPQVLQENLAYAAQQNFVGKRYVDEKIYAGYIMGNVTFGKLNLLTGLRVEKTKIRAIGSRVLPTSGNSPDRVNLNGADANSLTGILLTHRFATSQFNYRSKPFPYLHLKYEVLPRLQARFSYTEAIGRPNFTDVLPTVTQNDTNFTITTNRAGLLPQRSRNFDTSVEYYTKSAGEWTFGWFSRDVKDYISAATLAMTPELLEELNLGSEYSNYQVITKQNLGFAKWTGYELAVRQQLRDWEFVPEVLGGLEFFANYTHLYKVEGQFDTATASNAAGRNITTLAELVPRILNAGVSYRSPKGKWFVNMMTNYQAPRYTSSLPAADAAAQRQPRQESYQFWNFEASYNLSERWKLTCVGRNLFGERPIFSEVGIIRNTQQDSGPAWIMAARWSF
jgi:iron complex outermembrane receptor protein